MKEVRIEKICMPYFGKGYFIIYNNSKIKIAKFKVLKFKTGIIKDYKHINLKKIPNLLK